MSDKINNKDMRHLLNQAAVLTGYVNTHTIDPRALAIAAGVYTQHIGMPLDKVLGLVRAGYIKSQKLEKKDNKDDD